MLSFMKHKELETLIKMFAMSEKDLSSLDAEVNDKLKQSDQMFFDSKEFSKLLKKQKHYDRKGKQLHSRAGCGKGFRALCDLCFSQDRTRHKKKSKKE